MNSHALGLVMAAVTGLCWATLAIALRQAMAYASTGTIVWFRMVIAFLILVAFYTWKDPKNLKLLWPKPLVLLSGLGLATNYFAYMRGLELTSASNAQIMIQLGPLLLLLTGILHFKERLTRSQSLGLLCAGIGFALFFWDQIVLAVADAPRYIRGNLWIVLAAITWALFAALQKGVRKDWTPQKFNMVIYWICTLALWPTAHLSELAAWSPAVWVLMLACGLNTLIAYGAFAEALKRAPASQVSLIISANPLVTIFLVAALSWAEVSWVSPEPMAWRGVAGALLVVSGVALTVIPDPRRLVRTKKAALT